MKALRLPERLRPVLQRPLGRLLKGGLDEIYGSIRLLVEWHRPPRFVTVGDVVTRDAVEQGLKLDLALIDLKTKRTEKEEVPRWAFKRSVRAWNPPGLITAEACGLVASCLKEGGSVLIEVEGEEDLLTIPCVLHAPKGSVILYGQPNEGVVVLVVDEGVRAFFKSLLESFEEVRVK
ncbi:MAG: hypothetical protein DRJ69_05280 [Thermoprotei archaeon]|nr:MAG: hypothetical protein DRJ69_05280 [Thermoprotei archaeon]